MSTFSEFEFLSLFVTVANKCTILTTVGVLLNSNQILVVELRKKTGWLIQFQCDLISSLTEF